MRKQFISATAATLCALCLGFAASAAEVAQYSLTADNAQVTAGNIVELSLRCDSAATPTAALSLQFTLPEGYAVYDVDSGSGIVSNELSYSYTDSTLNVLYLDNDAGGSPVESGSEVAKIKLTAATPGTGRPLVCIESDASLVTVEGKVETQGIDLTISDMTVTGEAVPVPTTVPSVSTDGKKQTMAEASSNAASESATVTERLQEQQAKQNGDAAANELPPTATPEIITDANGNKMQIVRNERVEENVVDVTEDVLNAQPATTPTTEAQPAVDTVPQQSNAALPVALVVVVVIAAAAAGVVCYKKKK
jgi:hypothetical protein